MALDSWSPMAALEPARAGGLFGVSVQAWLGRSIRTRIAMPGNLRPAGGLLPAPGSLAVSLRQTPREEHHSAAVALLGELMTEALQGWLDR